VATNQNPPNANAAACKTIFKKRVVVLVVMFVSRFAFEVSTLSKDRTGHSTRVPKAFLATSPAIAVRV